MTFLLAMDSQTALAFVATPIINSTIATNAIAANSPITNLTDVNISNMFFSFDVQLDRPT